MNNNNGMRYCVNAMVCLLLFISATIARANPEDSNNYEVGVGIYDITGEIVETPYFGYADPLLKSGGLRDRQYARAFIVQEPSQAPVVFVNIDKGGMFMAVNQAVMARLQTKYNGLYNDANTVISATHTHVASGGHSHYPLYKLSSGGFYKKSFDVLVDGIVAAIERAHNSLAPGRIYFNRGSLTNASVNRSRVAYENNVDAAQFSDIDDDMLVLKFVQGTDNEVGMIAWFGVHPVSLPKTWKLASGDNKGNAAMRFEAYKNATYGENPGFVAAFANSNAGDMSPNLNMPGPDQPSASSSGPGATPEDSLLIIGGRQYQTAKTLYNTASTTLSGPVRFASRYSDFSTMTVEAAHTNGAGAQFTCEPALGTSFAAGAEDGRSGLFQEGLTKDPNFGTALDRCHAEKPIFVPTGLVDFLTATPQILPTSILQIGQLGLLALPAEITVMAGRRARATVEQIAGTGITETIMAAYSDAYSGYVTTREEYASQQYEGASTHFGPWTAAAYRQEFARLAQVLANPLSDPWPVSEPAPPVLDEPSDSTTTVLFDDKPWFKNYGDVETDVASSYGKGDLVSVTFWGAHPSNDLQTEGTYLEVQRLVNGTWYTVATDRDQYTKLIWERNGVANSLITVTWQTLDSTPLGTYRIFHDGHEKNGWTGNISHYSGTSSTFTLNETPPPPPPGC